MLIRTHRDTKVQTVSQWERTAFASGIAVGVLGSSFAMALIFVILHYAELLDK